MKALGVVFSARKRGNCLNCVEYVLKKLEKSGFATEVINAYDYEIKPCSHCNYECFAKDIRGREEKCPIQDDVPWIYEKVREADVVVLAVPNYGGNVSGLYRAWAERGQAIFKSYEDYAQTILNKIIGIIVIGNIPAGGDNVLHTLILDHIEVKRPVSAVLLQSAEYGLGSLYGNLIENEQVKSRLDNMVRTLLKKWEKARKQNEGRTAYEN
jgi:multimeric flavodoxin WrbA